MRTLTLHCKNKKTIPSLPAWYAHLDPSLQKQKNKPLPPRQVCGHADKHRQKEQQQHPEPGSWRYQQVREGKGSVLPAALDIAKDKTRALKRSFGSGTPLL